MKQRLLDSPWDEVFLPVILFIEDSDEDFYTFVRFLKETAFFERSPYRILRFDRGDEALAYLLRQEEYAGF